MKKKLFLTESDRKQILANKEKAILENFAKTFNKIKRVDENEINEDTSPNTITVKLTDEWKNSHNLYKMPNEVKLLNNDEVYSYIGNTRLDGFNGIFYFASRKGNLIFITGLDSNGSGKNYDIDSLTSPYAISKYELEKSGLRNYPSGTTTLGPPNGGPDYTGELEIGMKDHRGYFEIVSVN